ncbi:hypothetical protein CGRA01v4_11036 [Colletotrichum graminicola]|uniref:Uncharacterized protein n=1 Tax=Colletotrichum graminicola (strain M1.001 / M2 / FGSC 10212) TaxID=645133 RepID=E3QKR4_COLGM|nr:uncharacterized protein GLRG_06596 [Colletotrichum graminicola M1.001]EFQ31452.1 hypothetical protein GLRG_06596 [Colletotrichum graminicola M1.001]WDK19749.1 hypothetical protein CGRA01v4_11036 [Colletotrichum graminicola]
MPAVNHPQLGLYEPPSAARSYHHFTFSHLCTGLALIVLLTVFRLVACRALSSTTSKKERAAQSHKPVLGDIDHLIRHPRLHHPFVQQDGWVMEEKKRRVSSDTEVGGLRSAGDPDPQLYFSSENEKEAGEGKGKGNSSDPSSRGVMFAPGKPSNMDSARFMLSRPQPPPPLTPPEMSPSVFTYDERRRSFTSGVSELDASFFEQPNPDYMSSTFTGASTATQSTHTTRFSMTPRRRSYTKTLSIGMPIPSTSPIFDDAEMTFSPSSYPPTSSLLPGPPPIYGEILYDEATNREILVQGEIISLLDDAGQGWKRHTRVYGGGVCLACAASGDDGHHGGFYGENVLPEEKWY